MVRIDRVLYSSVVGVQSRRRSLRIAIKREVVDED